MPYAPRVAFVRFAVTLGVSEYFFVREESLGFGTDHLRNKTSGSAVFVGA